MGGFGLFHRALGGVKIHQVSWYFFPLPALHAEVAHAIALDFVGGNDLERSVFHAELLIGQGKARRRQHTEQQHDGK